MTSMDFSVSSDILAELLDVSVNVILYTRKVYPSQVFTRKRKYNTSVMVSAYPSLTGYIETCVSSVKTMLQKGQIQKVFLVIMSRANTVVEKFVFDVEQKPTTKQKEDEVDLRSLEETLRSFCLKLSTANGFLPDIPEDSTFLIQVEVPESQKSEKNLDDYPWIEPEKNEVDLPNSKIVPVKKIRSDVCNLQLYVEHSSDALKS